MPEREAPSGDIQLSLDSGARDGIIDRLRMIDISALTPIEALNILNELKNKATE